MKPVRTKLSEKYVNPKSRFQGVQFGQKEDLTRRIQNILRDYPFDITVLKELLQNADDAKAHKMSVILDKRTHGMHSVLSENWQKLQGPALLVWNDSTFSEKDIEGIQELGLGSKRSEAETIGQYGIGFNSVYHLTDCPSFVTNGDTLCVMDPHCQYAPGATPLSPGRRYDKLKSGFWDDFQDMKSAYLQSNIENLPEELLGGSLFRFPLRSTLDMAKSSQIVADLQGMTKVTSADMQKLLDSWVQDMKAAMFFLNNVRELQFFVIEKNANVLKTQYHFCIDISPSSQKCCDHLHKTLSSFTQQRGSKSCVVIYPLTIVETLHEGDRDKKYRQKWLIQQGVGDIENNKQHWTFVRNVKPRHGIAAPIDTVKSIHNQASVEKFSGQVFCFLPLPISSCLPIHVNGHFVLDSSRRQLWQTTTPGEDDGQSTWNKCLLSAIASSYANFISNAHKFLVSQEYSKWTALRNDIEKFFAVLPEADSHKLDKIWLSLAKECYKKVCKSNSSILPVIHKSTVRSSLTFTVNWHPIKSEVPSSQVYFWCAPVEQKKLVQPILEGIGMKITIAPIRFCRYLNDAVDNEQLHCPEISPETVFTYYCKFYSQITNCQFPCDIHETCFKSAENFKIFTNYVLKASDHSKVFPCAPFGYPLLLTADGMLRKFDKQNPVFLSRYHTLFPKSSALFVHPSLLEMNYSLEYFVKKDSAYDLIHRVLAEILPQCLCDTHKCRNTSTTTLIPYKKLQQLWQCFKYDSVFYANLSTILKRWALILTIDNQLFSTACELRPLLPLSNEECGFDSAHSLLSKIGVPVVDTSVVTTTTATCCPNIKQHSEVLTSLYYVNQDAKPPLNLSSNDVIILVDYLRSINYNLEQTSCDHVKTLPIFEDVVGNFTTISEVNSYIWPRNCTCTTAYQKWLEASKYSVVFLKYNASWTQLTTQKALGVYSIQAEHMYAAYIFPYFYLLSETERYQHLRYIRDNLFYSNKLSLEYPVSREAYLRAVQFIPALKNLQCIGRDENSLRKVSDFCDHEKEIFTTFSQHFQFLPDYFTKSSQETSEWLKFFRELGLRSTIAHNEFETFCKETAEGKVTDVPKASSVLIDSLFSAEKDWYDNPSFLFRVSRIPFLCAEKVPLLTWIVPPATTSRIHLSDGRYINMVEPCSAALVNYSTILWSVKALVVLPEKEELLKKLSVCTKPSNSDVIQNLENICKHSKLADIHLFDKYPSKLRQPEHGISLSSVILDHFRYLQGNLSISEECSLQQLPCIPVHASSESDKISMVLVRPQSVLACSVNEYHPFLNKLPDEFRFVTHILERIGVKHELDVKHMQIVLESAYKCTGGKEMEMNTKSCVFKAVQGMYRGLKKVKENAENESNTQGDNIGVMTSPLYLPSRNGTLVLSTNLLYCDKPYFRSKRLELGTCEYSELDIPTLKYGSLDSWFCELLPSNVQPKKMSELCTVRVAPDCKQCRPNDIANKVNKTLHLSLLPQAITRIVKHKLPKSSSICENFQSLMCAVLKSINVITYSKLKLEVLLKETENIIGNVKLPFYLEMNDETGNKLHLDSTLNDRSVLLMFSELAELIVSSAQQLFTTTPPLYSMIRAIEFFLRAESDGDILLELERRQLPITDSSSQENLTLSVGDEIPAMWQHRLNHNIDNVFHANEYVGYEDEEDHFIVVKIVHIISPGSVEDSISQYTKKYLVITSKSDEEGTKVSVLCLYKFTKGGEKEKELCDCHSVVLYGGEASPSTTSDDLSLVLSYVCEELDKIWKLEPGDRNRAIRRLYFRWHPDRNIGNQDFTEKVFKVLTARVQKLEQEEKEHAQQTSTFCSSQFSEWNRTAQQQQSYYTREQYNRGGSRGNSSGWTQSSAFVFTEGDDDFRVPRNQEEGRRWLRQATVDLKVLNLLYNRMSLGADDDIAGHICFMAHQVAEKVLKAGMYAMCGLDEMGLRDHELSRHACALQTEKPRETQNLCYHSRSLETYYVDTRYPNRHIPPDIPAVVYSSARAEEAKEHATNVFSIVQSLFDSLDINQY